jgi:hypothetical protein
MVPVDHSTGGLFPGAYAQVHFRLPRGAGSMSVPAGAVLFRSADLQVAVVGADDVSQCPSAELAVDVRNKSSSYSSNSKEPTACGPVQGSQIAAGDHTPERAGAWRPFSAAA